jgi:hypothetical protein
MNKHQKADQQPWRSTAFVKDDDSTVNTSQPAFTKLPSHTRECTGLANRAIAELIVNFEHLWHHFNCRPRNRLDGARAAGNVKLERFLCERLAYAHERHNGRAR